MVTEFYDPIDGNLYGDYRDEPCDEPCQEEIEWRMRPWPLPDAGAPILLRLAGGKAVPGVLDDVGMWRLEDGRPIDDAYVWGWAPRENPRMNLDVSGNHAKPRPCCGSDHRGREHGPQCALPDGFPETEQVLCSDCPPPDYPTDETRCTPCPRRAAGMSKRRMYDERCYDLAVHFIGTEKKDELCADLANDIQQVVEDWFERHPEAEAREDERT